MKNVFIWAAMLSLLTVSCGSEKAGNSVDVEDAAEALSGRRPEPEITKKLRRD